MTVKKVWLALSMFTAALVAIASACGILVGSIYARETASWIAQGMGQDIVTLTLATPLLIIGAIAAARGSYSGRTVWLGALIYLAYSYVVYAFFVHFGPLFLVYVAVLGTSVWALGGGLAGADLTSESTRNAHWRWRKPAAALLMLIAVSFAGLWLTDIIRSLAAGVAPASATTSGLAVNPVHVLDLAFLIPATIATSVLLWRRRPLGSLLAGPLLVFCALLAAAILSMAFEMRLRGVQLGV